MQIRDGPCMGGEVVGMASRCQMRDSSGQKRGERLIPVNYVSMQSIWSVSGLMGAYWVVSITLLASGVDRQDSWKRMKAKG